MQNFRPHSSQHLTKREGRVENRGRQKQNHGIAQDDTQNSTKRTTDSHLDSVSN